MKKIIAAAGIFSILSFPCFSKEKLDPNDLKKVTGQAGIVVELGEMTVKVKYGEISYTDEDGLGSITKAGIRVEADDKGSTFFFKPVTDFEQYSNASLKKIFGNKIGSIGLTKSLIENQNFKINRRIIDEKEEKDDLKKEEEKAFSHLIIETSTYCSLLTSIGLFNSGLTGLTKDQIIEKNLNTGGIITTLPSVEGTIQGSTRSLIVFTEDQNVNAMNENQTLLTIERGPGTQVIFGGTVEISPNN
jgi:hypothetical protein